MTKFEKGAIISVIVIMIGIFIGILCLMFSHYHETNKKPVVNISKRESTTIYSIKFYDDYAVYLSETDGVVGIIENENKRLDYKNEIDLKDVKSKLKATALSSGDVSVSINKEEFFVSDDNAVLKELLQSVGKEKLEG
ncbi:MAG: hypothetical protein IJA94_06030 [Bacilli bacterium]|nr:hypothetical protein [Bacilli bacterium]